MSLVDSSEGESSFYESFSDLIFGTLVLFLVMVMALALQLRETQADANEVESAAQLVYEGRFAGGSDSTRVFLTHLPFRGEPAVAWIPESASFRWDVDWESSEGDTGPETICRYFLEYGDAIFMPLDEFLQLDSAATYGFVRSIAEDPRLGEALYLAREISSRDSGRAWTAEELALAIGGNGLAPRNRSVSSEIDRLSDEYRDWKQRVGGSRDLLLGMSKFELLDAMVADDDPPILRFTVVDDEVRLGDVRVAPMQMRAILRSIKPGKGFYVEHVGPNGEREVPPPQWFMDQVLVPTGFTSPMLSDEGLAELGRRDD